MVKHRFKVQMYVLFCEFSLLSFQRFRGLFYRLIGKSQNDLKSVNGPLNTRLAAAACNIEKIIKTNPID